LTFLRFFEVFVGVSESCAEARFSFDGELLLGALAAAASLPAPASLEDVMSLDVAPLELRMLSGIK
jgi:hypothetical protein|tara:strand:- start:18113 stop:18310 length:198 start_codon:yes stop_codon:yes gene_type:complete